jgi:glycosyltransferase involved in cell wall biosynthesis
MPQNTLLIVSHVIHYTHDNQLYAYGPYTREIDMWADLFPRVVIASPLYDTPPPGDAIAFTRSNISMAPQPETGGNTRAAKARQLILLPALLAALSHAMIRADAIHVRCPGNLGLLGCVLAPLFSRYRVAKYAGQWNGYVGESLSGRLQRALLRSRWWNAPVTVYGNWPDQPAHIVPFFTSMMTEEQVRRSEQAAAQKHIGHPLRVLFAGRLETVKRVPVLLEAVAQAHSQGVALDVAIVGDGTQRAALEAQVERLGLGSLVRFVGALPYEDMLDWYEWAHCLVLPSTTSEGWPKVVAEAMCFGVLAIAVNHGQVAEMLKDRGILLENGTADEIAAALGQVAADPAAFQPVVQRAATWSRAYSLEGLREALRALLSERWGEPVGVSA